MDKRFTTFHEPRRWSIHLGYAVHLKQQLLHAQRLAESHVDVGFLLVGRGNQFEQTEVRPSAQLGDELDHRREDVQTCSYTQGHRALIHTVLLGRAEWGERSDVTRIPGVVLGLLPEKRRYPGAAVWLPRRRRSLTTRSVGWPGPFDSGFDRAISIGALERVHSMIDGIFHQGQKPLPDVRQDLAPDPVDDVRLEVRQGGLKSAGVDVRFLGLDLDDGVGLVLGL